MNRQDAKNAKIEPDQELDDLARQVIGAIIEVHRHLGPGFIESVYEEALAVEFTGRGLSYERQKPVAVNYKGNKVGQGRLDFLVRNVLVVEVKAVEGLVPVHKAQVISYLKAAGLKLGLLVNFNVRLATEGVQRVVFTES